MESIRVEHELCTVRRPVNMYQHHAHRQCEIYYLRSGTRKYFIGDKVYAISPGDFALIPSYVLHRTSGENFERILLYFDPKTLPPRLEAAVSHIFQQGVIRTPNALRPYMELLLERMCHEYNDSRDADMLEAQLTCLLLELARLVGEAPAHVDTPVTNLIMEIVSYINETYAEDMTVEQLAARAYWSRSHFCRKFKAVTGFSPLEYINSVRLQAAEHLLETTSMSITEIAERTGFSGSNYFGDLFRKCRGVSPRTWRNNQKNKA